MTALAITFDTAGTGHCLYSEVIPLQTIGRLSCRRATDIEFHAETQRWQVRHADDRKLLFSDPSRDRCLKWERENLDPVT